MARTKFPTRPDRVWSSKTIEPIGATASTFKGARPPHPSMNLDRKYSFILIGSSTLGIAQARPATTSDLDALPRSPIPRLVRDDSAWRILGDLVERRRIPVDEIEQVLSGFSDWMALGFLVHEGLAIATPFGVIPTEQGESAFVTLSAEV